MVNFYPEFVNCSPNATVEQVASKHYILCVGVCVCACVCMSCVVATMGVCVCVI